MAWSRNPSSYENMRKEDFHGTGKAWENTKISNLWILKYFGWSRNPHNSQNIGKVNPHNNGDSMGKKKYSKVMGFLNILGEAEIYTIPEIWEKWDPIVREKHGKTQTCQS